MSNTQFTGYLKAFSGEKHPLQSTVQFVFTDFNPNNNKQGVRASEAANLIRSGLGQPVKVNFDGDRIRDHANSVPVGAITDLSQDGDKIVGTAVLWKKEFPEFIEHLEQESSASEGGVQFSWELFYKDEEVDSQGVQWLKDTIVRAITFVSTPAYAGRTPLLSIAEDQSVLESRIKELEDSNTKRETMELEAVVAQITEAFNARLDALDERIGLIVPAQAEQVIDPDVEALTQEVAELREYKNQAEAAKARAELLSARAQTLDGVMTSEEFNSKADFIATLSDEQFTEFANSLQSVASRQGNDRKQTQASGRTVTIPDPVTVKVDGTSGTVSVKDISLGLQKLSLRQ